MKLPAETLPPMAPMVTARWPGGSGRCDERQARPARCHDDVGPGTPPTVTAMPCRFVPVIVTVVPPAVVPDVGDISVNVGGPMNVNVPAGYRAAAVRQVQRSSHPLRGLGCSR